MQLPVVPPQGRGAASNPMNRFERLDVEVDLDHLDPDAPSPRTEFLVDATRSVISENDSPDVGFRFSINPYRGCEHGCIYCYARPTHEYLGLSTGLDFETKVFVKRDAPQLLRAELMRASWKGDSLSFSGVTDCYQPIERTLKLTRRCIEVLAEFRNPLSIITKSHLITRDIDLLQPLARQGLAVAILSVTTLDPEVSRTMEPRAASPQRRLDAIRELAAAGIPTAVMIAPVVPGLTDHEMPAILSAARAAGAQCCGYVPLRLPFAVKELFEQWLNQHFPDRAGKVLSRIRQLRGGKLNDSNWHSRMRGEGVFADQMKSMFELAKRRAGLTQPFPELRSDLFTRPARDGQLPLFAA
jgi:DNA repair photolyase